MNTKELRIGNYVKCRVSNDTGIYQVIALDSLKVMLDGRRIGKWYMAKDKINPIMITQECLLKLGFKIETSHFTQHKNGTIFSISEQEKPTTNDGTLHGYKTWFYNFNPKGYLEPATASGDIIEYGIVIQYVHQIQNRHFSLTGEELREIKK